MLWKAYKKASNYRVIGHFQQSIRGCRDFLKLEATSGAQFLIAAGMHTAQVVYLCTGELHLVNSSGGPVLEPALICCRRNTTCPTPFARSFWRAPHFGQDSVLGFFMKQPTKVIIINLNYGDGLPNSVQRGHYTAIRLQQTSPLLFWAGLN